MHGLKLYAQTLSSPIRKHLNMQICLDDTSDFFPIILKPKKQQNSEYQNEWGQSAIRTRGLSQTCTGLTLTVNGVSIILNGGGLSERRTRESYH